MLNPRIEELFRNALPMDHVRRAAYLEAACAADPDLRLAVEERLGKMPTASSNNAETHITGAAVGVGDVPDLPNYKIRSVLGRGGMGLVYRAEQVPLHRLVAIKMLATVGPPTNEQLARFHAEAAALARLRHPNVVQIYDYGEWNKRPYFVMELVEGLSVAEQAGGAPQLPRYAAHLMMIVARAVQAVHQQGILHRDLKPGNILLQSMSAEDPHKTFDPLSSVNLGDRVVVPKITDFGVAKDLLDNQKLTMTGTAVGTPQYMAPEQAESEWQAIGPATDVYGLGASLYELLTGQPPIRGATPLETLAQIAIHEPAPPSRLQPGVPRDLDVICGKCLEKLPTRRYPTAQALADDLQRFLDQIPIKARPTGPFRRIARWCRRRPLVAGFAGLSALLAAALIASMIAYDSWLATALGNAKESAAESQLRLVKLFTVSGMADVDEGLAINGLLWFAEGLRHDQGHGDAERRHRVRIATTSRRTPQLLHVWGGAGPIMAVAASSEAHRVAIAEKGGSIKIWDLATGKPLGEPLPSSATISSLALSKDGEWVSALDDKGAVRIWQIGLTKSDALVVPGEKRFDFVAFHPQEKLLIIREAGGYLRLWDPSTKLWRPIPGLSTTSLGQTMVCANGRWTVTISEKTGPAKEAASEPVIARVWPTLEGPGQAKPINLERAAKQAAVNSDGSRLAILDDQGTASLWDARTGDLLKGPLPHLRAVLTMHFSPGGDLLLTTSADHRGRIWSAVTGELVTVGLRHRSDAVSLAFSDDGRLLATGGIDNQAAVWDLVAGEQRTPPLQHQGSLRYVGFGQSNDYLITADEAAVRLWKINSLPTKVQLPGVQARTAPLKEAVSADGRLRVEILGNVAQVSDNKQGRALGAPLVHASAILFACFSPNGEVVVTTSEDNTARLWNSATGELLTPPLFHNGDVLFAAFSPNGKELVTTSDDRTARLWDVATGEPLSPSWLHDDHVVAASFSPDGLQVFTRDELGQMYTWDITPDPRPVDEILLWAQVVSGSRFMRNRGIIPLEADGLLLTWQALQKMVR